MKFIAFLLFFSSLFSTEIEAVKRIHSHLLIRDYRSALRECEEKLQEHPESVGLKKVYIRALAENGKDDEAIMGWKQLGFDKGEEHSDLLETLAWGVLTRLESSPQYIVNIAALMSAYYTDDVRAVRMLLSQLNSSNALLRAMAAQLSPRYRDVSLIEELTRLLAKEKVWFVRLEVINALGAMQIKEVKEPLVSILTRSRVTAEEKGAAIASLVNIYEDIEDEELLKLIRSKRAGLRHLACQIVNHLDLTEKAPMIEALLGDSTSDVRMAALTTLYFMGLKKLGPGTLAKIVDLTEDPHSSVALAAAWVVSHFAPETALRVVRRWVYSTDEASRRLAAFILGRMGHVGMHLSHQVLKLTPDPFVRVNLALGGVGQGASPVRLSEMIYSFLILRNGKLMWDSSQSPLFRVLAPSKVCHIPQMPQYPTMVDHLTRLEILGMLAALKHPKAEDAIKSFLTEHALGVTYAASNTLLEEGGEETIEILRELLHEEDENVRVQAALVLAISGGETEAVQVLQEAYYYVDREMKVNILGALGYIGDKTSIPFLIDLLEEPYQILKVVAASALIQCVYH